MYFPLLDTFVEANSFAKEKGILEYIPDNFSILVADVFSSNLLSIVDRLIVSKVVISLVL